MQRFDLWDIAFALTMLVLLSFSTMAWAWEELQRWRRRRRWPREQHPSYFRQQ